MRRSVHRLFLAIVMALCPLFLVAQDFVGFDDFLRQYEVAPPGFCEIPIKSVYLHRRGIALEHGGKAPRRCCCIFFRQRS